MSAFPTLSSTRPVKNSTTAAVIAPPNTAPTIAPATSGSLTVVHAQSPKSGPHDANHSPTASAQRMPLSVTAHLARLVYTPRAMLDSVSAATSIPALWLELGMAAWIGADIMVALKWGWAKGTGWLRRRRRAESLLPPQPQSAAYPPLPAASAP